LHIHEQRVADTEYGCFCKDSAKSHSTSVRCRSDQLMRGGRSRQVNLVAGNHARRLRRAEPSPSVFLSARPRF